MTMGVVSFKISVDKKKLELNEDFNKLYFYQFKKIIS